MPLTPLEQLSLVVDTVTKDPISHVYVRAYGLGMFMRYDPGGMPLLPNPMVTEDWTLGLPEDLRAALRAIVTARAAKRAPPETSVTIARHWIDEQMAGALGEEARTRSDAYLAAYPTGRLRVAKSCGEAATGKTPKGVVTKA